jgi:hypothetical protein
MRALVYLALVVCLLPSSAIAQGIIEGDVRDASGRPVAGALVEAQSTALIEGAREVRSDASGRFRLEALPPGSYVVTIIRSSFKTLEIQGVELSSSRTAVVRAELMAGAPQETVTSVHDATVVEVRTATRRMSITNDVIRALPTRRNYKSLLVLMPGVTTDRDDMVIDPLPATFPIHGGRLNEGRLFIDGMNAGSAPNGGSPAHYIVDAGTADEVTFAVPGGLGEVETGGLVLNIVSKQGGNAFRGTAFVAGNSEGMDSQNIDDRLRAFGVPHPPSTRAWEVSASIGGALARERAWYFVSGRRQTLRRLVPGLYSNQNAGNPAAWQFTPDFARPVYSERTWDNAGIRLTLLATPKNRFSVFHDEQAICRSCDGATAANGLPDATVSLEAQGVGDVTPQRFEQVSWLSTPTNRLLFEAGYARNAYAWGNSERDDNDRSLIRVSGSPPLSGQLITYRSQDWFENQTALQTWQGAASLRAAGHSIKVGYQGLFATDDRTFQSNDQNLTYRISNGVPTGLTQVISPFTLLARVSQTSAYVQDQWARGRLSVQAAVRYDRVRSWFPEQQIGPTRFLPAGLTIPETSGVDAYSDITPRLGGVFDVAGNGMTALKISAGKYLEGAGTTGIYYDSNPAANLLRSVNRGWTDINVNFVPDCNLDSPLANGECSQAASTIGLGQPIPVSFDPELLSGSGVRPSDWRIGASVEQQILPRASLEIGYVRRWFDGFTVGDNVLVSPADFQTVSATAPTSASLPGGGGQSIGPFYFQSAASLPGFQQVTSPADRYGQQSLTSDALDVIVNGRTAFGLTFQGGSSTRWTTSDSCEIRAAVPESSPLNPYCDTSTGALTQFRALATYTIPAADVQIGAVYQDKPGPPIAANATLFLGAPVSITTVNIIEPGTLYGERIAQLDLRVAKVLRFGRRRAAVGIDLYNALNSSDALAYTSSFVQFVNAEFPARPTSVMSPRLLRITADVSF